MELDKILCKFWFEVRTQEGDYYKIGSFENLRYSLNRLLQSKGHEFDIVHGDAFMKRRKKFQEACKELKAKGYGVRECYKEIIPSGKSNFSLFLIQNHKKITFPESQPINLALDDFPRPCELTLLLLVQIFKKSCAYIAP